MVDKPLYELAQSLLRANVVLSVAVGAALSAQVIKFLLFVWYRKRARFDRLIGAGGMPSAHSAMVTALASGIGRHWGFGSPAFSVAAVFALIVLYDAVGVRRTVGLQSRVLNRISQRDGGSEAEQRLPEFVGHTPVEVLAGTVWGVIWVLIF